MGDKKNKSVYGSNGRLNFAKLWILLEKKHHNKLWLRENGIHSNTIQKLVNNENVTCDVLTRLCYLLECDVKNICEYEKPDNIK